MSPLPASEYFDIGPEPLRLFPPCRSKCPIHIDVPGYLTMIAEGRYTEALQIVLDRNPLPSVCGRICVRPCEDGCRRCNVDDPLAIASLKRAAADFGSYPAARPDRPRPESIAIVGSGPAGLTAAFDLAQRGFQVTIYEAKDRLGGMLRYGIPNYRLPDNALDKDINYILAHGVTVETGVKVGTDITLDELRAKHTAVVLSAGLQGSRPLPIPGADQPRVLSALPFLEAAANGEKPEIGERVVVVGGGNVAMDVARTARRLGAKHVDVSCLESEAEMPASEEEVHEARQEGISLHCSWGPVEVALHEDGVCGLDVKRCVSVFDAEKRFSPVFDDADIKRFDADTVIFATGQFADVRDIGVELSPRGGIIADAESCATNLSGVYAAGDVVTGPSRVVDAISAGHRVAMCIVRDLTNDARPLAALDEESRVLGSVPQSMMSKLETRRRVQMEKLEFYEAVDTFDEIEMGYTEYEAAREAQRCLGCTTGARLTREKCASCLTCLRVCPHNAPGVKIGGFLYFDAETCHACGACVSQCPAQAISLEGHSDAEMMLRVERLMNDPGLDTTLAFACGCTPNLPDIPGDDVRTLTVTCHLRIAETTALKALQSGASRIAFVGCVESNCRFPHARKLVAQRVERIQDKLRQLEMSKSLYVPAERTEDEDVHLR
ncbi:MAG: FAD-dependent oxidoreductase [Coriobacteriia bacterium]|nr:FAD-dependent oxidoreductase [Coriobacteriia bacterium]